MNRLRRAFVRRLRHWIVNRGVGGLLREMVRQVGWRLAPRPQARGGVGEAVEGGVGSPLAVHPFDEEHGVDTGGLVWGEDLGSGARTEYWATAYYGVAPSVLWQALDRLGLEWERFTFIDVGCGKGRGVMAALRYPFRRVLGVELSPGLATAAERNLERFQATWRRDVPAEVVAGDATTIELPGGPLLLYLYHPFAAPVMRLFLENVRVALRREPREIYVVYVNPEVEGLLAGTGFLERIWRDCFRLADEDVRGDRFGSRQEVVAAYRSIPGPEQDGTALL